MNSPYFISINLFTVFERIISKCLHVHAEKEVEPEKDGERERGGEWSKVQKSKYFHAMIKVFAIRDDWNRL